MSASGTTEKETLPGAMANGTQTKDLEKTDGSVASMSIETPVQAGGHGMSTAQTALLVFALCVCTITCCLI